MNALDLYCGIGGSAQGMYDAGITDITGIDIDPKPDYPYRMIKGDVLKLPSWWIAQFDLVWASPPCQLYSSSTNRAKKEGKSYPDLIEETRELLQKARVKYVIENVIGAPIRKDLMLCGEMFNLKVIRHRIFEIEGFTVIPLTHKKHRGRLNITYPNQARKWKPKRYYFSVCGNDPGTINEWQQAIGVNWSRDRHELAQCVPPKYSEYITKYMINPVITLPF